MEKNKKILIISAILILVAVFANFLLSYLKNELKFDLYNILIIISSLIGVIYYFMMSRKQVDLNKHYKSLLFVSILIVLFSSLFAGILGIVVYKSLDVPKKEKRELPVIEDENFTNKYICLIAFAVCLYLIMVPTVEKISHMIILYISLMLIMILVFRKQLIRDFKLFKEYFREYMSLTLKTWVKSFVVMIIISLTIQIITGTENSNNQQNLQEVFNKIPVVMAFVTVIYAPIVEELMFRGVFKKFLKNKYLFIILSGVIFGLMHVIDDSKTLAEYSYVLVYSSLGIFLASLYYKTNNLFTNMTFHFIQNSLAVIGMIILKFMV